MNCCIFSFWVFCFFRKNFTLIFFLYYPLLCTFLLLSFFYLLFLSLSISSSHLLLRSHQNHVIFSLHFLVSPDFLGSLLGPEGVSLVFTVYTGQKNTFFYIVNILNQRIFLLKPLFQNNFLSHPDN